MAITIETSTPNLLLKMIREEIQSGKIKTWICDDEGDFTHTSEQWSKKAWFRPVAEDGRLRFRIIPPRDSPITRYVYAVYHSEMVQLALAHFDSDFESIVASALPAFGDKVK